MPGPSLSRGIAGAVVAGTIAAAGVGLLVTGSYGLQLLGTAILTGLALGGAPHLARAYPFAAGRRRVFGREIDLEDFFRRTLPPTIVVVLVLGLLWPLILGQMPRSQDHIVHLTRAWIFLHELVAQGRITGWSSTWFAGYPAGQLYPPGSDLWVSTFRVLHLGLTDWQVTYAHAYLAFTIVGGLALYWLGQRATGSRFGGVFVGIVWVLDPGAYREGGWNFTVHWGVWSQVLGLVFCVLSLVTVERLLDRPSGRRAALAAASIGFALLGHPMSVVTLVLWISALLLTRWLCGRSARGHLAVTVGAAAWGGAIAAWWLLPFISRGEWTIRVPELWRSMDAAATGVVECAPFQNHWPVIGVLALIGLARALREGRPLPLALGASTAVLLFFSTTTAFEQFRLEDLSAAFGRIIYQRFSMPAKVGWFVLAACGAVTVAETLAKTTSFRQAVSGWRRIVAFGVVGLCAAPFLFHGLPSLGGRYFRGVGAIRLASHESDISDYHRFLDWSRERWEERDSFYRIAYVQPRNEHFFADAPVYNRTPAYKVGWTPCTTFRHRPESDDPEVFRALSVRYVASRRPLAGRHLTMERRFGSILVYRLLGESSERFSLVGPGRAEALLFEEERIRIRVTGAEEGTRLTLHVANYADWLVTRDGQHIVERRTAPIYDERYPTFLQIDVPRDGIVEARFVRPPLRWFCQGVSLLAVLALLFVFLSPRVGLLLRLGVRLRLGLNAAAPVVPLLIALAGIATASLVLSRWAGEPRDSMGPLTQRLDEKMGEATAELRRKGQRIPCPRRGEKLICPGPSSGWVGLKRVKIGILERPCIWAPPHRDAELVVTFPDVTLGRRLVGRHGFTDFAATQTPEGAAVRLQIEIDGGPTTTFVAPNEVGWHPWSLPLGPLRGEQRDLRFVISARDPTRRQYCFEGGVSDLAEP